MLAQPGALGHIITLMAWILALPAGEDIRVLHTGPCVRAVSSVKVLGSRTTLYNYFYRRLAVADPGRLVDGQVLVACTRCA